MKRQLLFLTILGAIMIQAQAQLSPIPPSIYTILNVSSDNPTHPVAHAFDGDTTTWWAIWNSGGFSLPAVVEIDLGTSLNLGGISYLPNPAEPDPKALSVEIYVTNDTTDWGEPQANRHFLWADKSDVNLQMLSFGTVEGRYVRVIFPSSQDESGNIHSSEIVLFEDATPPTGQQNQIISIDLVETKIGTDAPFDLTASASSGLPVSFEILSGPATVNGNTVSLTGSGGEVVVKATQTGDAIYYPSENYITFEVIDLTVFYPEVSTRLVDSLPLQMDSLSAYPIYVNATIDPLVEIAKVEVIIDGVVYETGRKGNLFTYLWTPEAFKTYHIEIKAYASNSNTTSLFRNVWVLNLVNSYPVRTMEDVVIWFGQTNSRWFYGKYTLPQQVGVFSKVNARLTVECPGGNCDDWDRLAYVDIKAPDGNWIQLIRYITPYGRGCEHIVDVSDYLSLLQGDIELRMFIDTWGTGGWQITLDFEFETGPIEYRYSLVEEIWDGAYDLGNPTNLQPVDTIHYGFAPNVEKAVMRLSNTGHGWGDNNSQNAAEFYDATHFIDIDSQETFVQHLWYDCNPNPDGCMPQAGTWQFSRAGWCPGMISPPDAYDLSTFIGQDTVMITYRFDPTYVDYCHPGNPNCISGTTCPNCNDGYKAVNHVDGHIINYSNQPMTYGELTSVEEVIDNVEIFDLKVFPNPNDGLFQIQTSELKGACRVRIFTIDGRQVKGYHFNSWLEMKDFVFDLTDQSIGTYYISLENNTGTGVVKVMFE